MSISEIFFIALGLSMDSLAVSIAAGAILSTLNVRDVLRIALFMGFFQALMPLIGWVLGYSFHRFICDYDHWIAFFILSILGGKMTWNGIMQNDEKPIFDPTLLLTLLSLAIATSIDALAVGVSFAFLSTPITTAAWIIGVTTFGISALGVVIGHKIGKKVNLRIEIIGGLILFAIGLKILVEHLFFQ